MDLAREAKSSKRVVENGTNGLSFDSAGDFGSTCPEFNFR